MATKKYKKKKYTPGDILITKRRFAGIPVDSPVFVQEVSETKTRAKKLWYGTVPAEVRTRLRVNYQGESYWSDPELYEGE